MLTSTLLFATPSGPTAEITDIASTSRWQYELVLYALVVAFLALFASGVYNLTTRSEVSKKYRASTVTSAMITWIAALAYLALIVVWLTKYHSNADGSTFTPEPGTIFTGLRFADWSVTVPLLVVELFAVCNIAKQKATAMRFAAMAAAFLMILTGLFGVIAVGQDNASTPALWVWGIVSTVFFVALYPLMLAPVRDTIRDVSAPTGKSLRNAVTLLLSVWGVYPLAYLVLIFTDARSTGWAVTIQLAFTGADIVAKAGYGALLHKVAKLRTAEDAGDADAQVPDTLPASVSLNGLSISLPGTAYTDGAVTNGHAVAAGRAGNGAAVRRDQV